jgi:hypothetical protein
MKKREKEKRRTASPRRNRIIDIFTRRPLCFLAPLHHSSPFQANEHTTCAHTGSNDEWCALLAGTRAGQQFPFS